MSRLIQKQKALKFLFHPETFPGMSKRDISEVKLLLWRNNSLGAYTTWTFIQAGSDCFVRRVIWNQQSTYNLNEPETYCADAITSKAVFNSIIETLHDRLNNVLFNAPTAINLDGVGYGLIYQTRRIEWWGTPEENLYELNKWHENTITYLEGLFDW